jgi:hypothetical protein
MKSISIGCFGSEMLTRRTATVTISAPDASTAAAFWAKSLYLPVPTISRDAKVRPATVHAVVRDRRYSAFCVHVPVSGRWLWDQRYSADRAQRKPPI